MIVGLDMRLTTLHLDAQPVAQQIGRWRLDTVDWTLAIFAIARGGIIMAETCFETRGIRHRRTVKQLRLAASIIGVALLAGIASAQAQKLTVWSGYPEMEPFYRRVADGMK